MLKRPGRVFTARRSRSVRDASRLAAPGDSLSEAAFLSRPLTGHLHYAAGGRSRFLKRSAPDHTFNLRWDVKLNKCKTRCAGAPESGKHSNGSSQTR